MIDQSPFQSSSRQSSSYQSRSLPEVPIFIQKVVDRCHVSLPDTPKPTSAIVYEGEYYVFVKHFTSAETAKQKAAQMLRLGNKAILTRVAKGLVLWVVEPDAQPTDRYSRVRHNGQNHGW